MGGGEEMLLQSLLGGITALTLGTSKVKPHKKKKIFDRSLGTLRLLLLLLPLIAVAFHTEAISSITFSSLTIVE